MAIFHTIFEAGFETAPISMVPFWQISFKGPVADLDRIFDEIVKIDPLIYGATDRNAYRSADGFEYYRPLDGAPTGAEDETRKRPGVSEMVITIEPDEAILHDVINAIYEFHSYYEPPITIVPVLRSKTKGLNDSDNPHRWWNKDGDWKQD